jgi:hypothetical protein
MVLALLCAGAGLADERDGRSEPRSDERQQTAPRPDLTESEWVAVLRIIREREPDLAEELARALEHDAQRDGDDRLDVTVRFLAEMLERAEHRRRGERPERRRFGPRGMEEGNPERQGPRGRRPDRPRRPGLDGPPGPNHPPPPPDREMELRLRELHQRHEQLERESQEIAERFRGELHGEGGHEPRDEMRHALERVVNEHFEVRTQLRQLELERLAHELEMLKRELERMQRQFEQRQRERDVIIQRRLRQLIGKDFGGW